jgi:purine-nucleoside/S-methyl-5'-thioadenosine phosphorylase / adenosine deaminase
MYKSEKNPPLYRWKIFDDYAHIVSAGVTSRSGGISTDPYSSFNQALHCGDESKAVIENRKILCRSQKISFEAYTCAEQTHSANICIVDEGVRGSGRVNYSNSIKNTDALIIRNSKILINIHLADCVPIAVFDIEKKIGALIHAGWRGTAHLITHKTIEYMNKELKCHPENMIAGIGPSIGSCCFEISKGTADALSHSFNYSPQIIDRDSGNYRADLKQANREQLINAGLSQINIESADICTCCSKDDFYSYRGEKGTTGRFSTFMMLN